MSLVQLLEPKWYFIYITSTHAGPGDDPTGEQNLASIVCEWSTCFSNVIGYYYDIFAISYFIYNLFDRTVGCA